MKRIKLLSFFAGVALALFLGSCANDDIAQQPTGTGDTPTDEATFEAAPAAPTRTTMSNTGAFKWQSGDKIWVKDDTGTWRQSSNAPTSETANFKFKVPGTFTGSNTYTVYYPGNGGNQDQVTISATQSQAAPNTPAHVGVSGDCGWATATAAAGTKRFNFTLDHKAAFLVFSPYTTNTVLNSSSVKLTKIEVTSDNDLVGTYTLDPANATNPLTGTGSGKQIELTTTGGSATPNGFSVPTAATPATNASYVVIKPGTHTLKVRFWLKDYTTNIEGTVTKLYPSFSYAANTYYSMSSELKITNYTTPYYMWDAQQPYWKDHEWDLVGHDDGTNQPTVNGRYGGAYPQNNTDSRYYNETYPGAGIQNDATQSHFTSLPNANEMSWYAMKGDPRWDGDELWTTMGHLYRGGMWFKKKAYISGFRSDKAADNSTDLRTASSSFINTSITYISSNPLSAADQSNYFYLPALGGYYYPGALNGVSGTGHYWSSSANPNLSNYAYGLGFGGGSVFVSYDYRFSGFSVRAFE